MSSSTVSISITAKDGTKSTFDAIKRGAEQDAAALQKMGTAGSAGLKQVDTAAKQTAKSTDDLNKRAAALGAAFTAGAAVLAQWSRNSQDAQAIQRQLEAAIEATGESYDLYADRIQAAGERAVQLGQDDEAASQAIAALTEVTGSANVALNQMGLVMDLAAAKHLSLESAAELVGKVIEGNTGILNRQGFAIDENATATEALATVQAAVAGQAEASATTYARMREELSNVTDAIGGAVGGFAPMLAMLPGLSVGFTAAGSAVGALAPNLTKAGAASAALNVALGPVGVVAAAAAAGLAIFELVKRADDASLSVKEAADEVKNFDEALASLGKGGTAKEALAGLADMREILVQLALASEQASQAQQSAALKESNAREAQTNALMGGTQAQQEAANAALAAAEEYSKQIEGTILKEEQLAQLAIDFKEIWTDQNPLNFDLVVAQLDHLKFQLDNGVISADEYVSAVSRLNAESDSYGLSIEEIVAGQRNQAGSTRDLTGTINELTAAQDRQAAAQQQQSANITQTYEDQLTRARGLAQTQDDQAFSLGNLFRQSNETAAGLTETGKSLNQLKDEAVMATAAVDENEFSLGNLFKTSTEGAPGIVADYQAQREELDKTVASLHQYADALGAAGSFASQLRPVDLAPKGGDKATGTAADLQTVGSALDSVLGTFKQLDSLGQAADQAGSIAENLIGDPGELAAIDRLLTQGRITTEQYNDAIEAGNDIRKESGAIENDLNTIRAKQLPILAEADKRYGDVIDNISRMNAAEAQATLGFMDTNEAMKAQNALALVASASMGDLGESGKAATQSILQGAVDADPVLGAMLEKMGVISLGADGKITINFDDAAEVQATLDDVVSSIEQVAIAIDLLDGVADLDITVEMQAEQAKKDAADTKAAIDDIPTEHNTDITETGSDSTRSAVTGTTLDVSNIPTSHNTDVTQTGAEDTQGAAEATTNMVNNIPFFHNVDISASDSASGTIAYVSSLLNDLDGQSATVFINTVRNDSAAPNSPFDALGGMIMPVTAAGGRLMTDLQRVRVNEGGQEMATLPTGDDVWLPTGSMVTPHAASTYGRGRTESGKPVNFWGTVNVYTSNPDDFIRQMQTYGVAGR